MTDLLIGLSSNGFPGPSNNVIFRRPASAANGTGIFCNGEIRHSRSEDLLGPPISRAPSPIPATASSEDDLIASSTLSDDDSCPLNRRTAGSRFRDRIDPEDSIRDMVTENDLCKFVLFKSHYDKYVALEAKYEEARQIAYYLEEQYHEVKAERDKLMEVQESLERRLESREGDVRSKEDELFAQIERSLKLEEEIERLRTDREFFKKEIERLRKTEMTMKKQLDLQLETSEKTRKILEKARLEVIKQTTIFRAERDAYERENNSLRKQMKSDQNEMNVERRRHAEGIAALTHEAITLRHAARHLRAMALHATSCRRRRRCSICLYARRTFNDIGNFQHEGKLFKCLQTPLNDIYTWLRPETPATTERTQSPEDPVELLYADEDFTSCNCDEDTYSGANMRVPEVCSTSSSQTHGPRAFSSDSGFSSDPGDRRSRSYECDTNSRKASSEACDTEKLEKVERMGTSTLTRSKWTASFRKLLGRKSKPKVTATES